eukprot:PhF_6_TR37855/c1_g1_i1/m.56380
MLCHLTTPSVASTTGSDELPPTSPIVSIPSSALQSESVLIRNLLQDGYDGDEAEGLTVNVPHATLETLQAIQYFVLNVGGTDEKKRPRWVAIPPAQQCYKRLMIVFDTPPLTPWQKHYVQTHILQSDETRGMPTLIPALRLLSAASYLHCERLLNLVCATIGSVLNDPSEEVVCGWMDTWGLKCSREEITSWKASYPWCCTDMDRAATPPPLSNEDNEEVVLPMNQLQRSLLTLSYIADTLIKVPLTAVPGITGISEHIPFPAVHLDAKHYPPRLTELLLFWCSNRGIKAYQPIPDPRSLGMYCHEWHSDALTYVEYHTSGGFSDFEAIKNQKYSFAHLAALYGKTEALHWYHEHVLNPKLMYAHRISRFNQIKFFHDVVDSEGRTPYHCAAEGGSLFTLKYLLRRIGWSTLSFSFRENTGLLVTDARGRTPIFDACEKGHLHVVKWFIEISRGALLDVLCKEKRTVLHAAASSGSVQLIEYILKHRPQFLYAQDITGATVLQPAVAAGSLPLIRVLIAKHPELMEIELGRKKGTLLFAAVYSNQLDTMKYVYKECPQLLSSCLSPKSLAHAAVETKNLSVLKWIHSLPDGPLVMEFGDDSGRSICHYAAYLGCLDILEWALETCSKKFVLSCKDIEERSLCHEAARGGHIVVLEWLEKIDKMYLTAKDSGSMNLCIHAAIGGHSHVIEWIHKRDPASLTWVSSDGKTAAHYACQYGHVKALRTLYNLNKNLFVVQSWSTKKTSLAHEAAKGGHTEVLEYLITIHSNILKQRLPNGRTPAMDAKEGGHAEALAVILREEPGQPTRQQQSAPTPAPPPPPVSNSVNNNVNLTTLNSFENIASPPGLIPSSSLPSIAVPPSRSRSKSGGRSMSRDRAQVAPPIAPVPGKRRPSGK